MDKLRTAATGLVLVTLLFAGCAGTGDDFSSLESGERPPDVTVDGQVVQGDAGIVRGQVLSDAGLVVPDARVIIIGTGHDGTTDDQGRFEFTNVTAGTHLLRIEAKGFRAHESDITVEAAAVLERTFTLVPLETTGAGYRPHIHDYWGERSEITIFDEPFDIRQSRVGSATADWNPQANYVSATVLYANLVYSGLRYWIPLPDDDPANPNIVFPGTGKVEVTFDWDDAPPMPPRYAFGYVPASDDDLVVLDAGGPGTTWTIDVEPGMTDAGHQTFSLWEFYVIPVNNVQDATNYRPSLITETIDVRITVYKGYDVPVEPPHPEFWRDGDVLPLLNASDGQRTYTGSGVFGGRPMWGLAPPTIVPPGTAKLVVEMTYAYSPATAEPLDSEYVLYWNTGDHNYMERPVSEWDTGPAAESGTGRAVYEIVLEPGQTDAFYQQKTAWRFAARIAGEDPDVSPDKDNNRGRTFTLSVVAFRDAGAGVI